MISITIIICAVCVGLNVANKNWAAVCGWIAATAAWIAFILKK